jgi:glycosyltransferase involved in cell wall biosynthesis
MRILAVHNRYLMGGGEDISHKTEVELLRLHGHTVDEMVEDNLRIANLGMLKTAFRTIWSFETYQKVRKILMENPYDVLLVQNFFPLISPSIYYAAARAGVPVIQFVRNYRLACLNATFLRNEKICEDCLGKIVPWPGVLHACYRNSRLASLVVAMMLIFHRLLGTWNKKVDRYIALSEFGREKLIASGIRAKKIVVRPNTLFPDSGAGDGSGGYGLFVGRLSSEKGLETLLSAWERMSDQCELIIIGDGPLRGLVNEQAKHQDNIKAVGLQTHEKTLEMIQKAKFLIFPSIWYEGMPRTILEAFAAGTPVLASDLGAMADMVQHGLNGYLFPMGNSTKLAEFSQKLFESPELCAQMRLEARNTFIENYSAETAYQKIEFILNDLVQEKNL